MLYVGRFIAGAPISVLEADYIVLIELAKSQFEEYQDGSPADYPVVRTSGRIAFLSRFESDTIGTDLRSTVAG